MRPEARCKACRLIRNQADKSSRKNKFLARAPGGQMPGAATQAMRSHRRGTATPQMPAAAPRRAAGSQAGNFLCCPFLGSASLGASSKMPSYFCASPKLRSIIALRQDSKQAKTRTIAVRISAILELLLHTARAARVADRLFAQDVHYPRAHAWAFVPDPFMVSFRCII